MSSFASTQRSNTSNRATLDHEQLTLLPASTVNPRFRLSSDTRARGLRHVAEIRERLAAGRDGQHPDDTAQLPRRAA